MDGLVSDPFIIEPLHDIDFATVRPLRPVEQKKPKSRPRTCGVSELGMDFESSVREADLIFAFVCEKVAALKPDLLVCA